MKITYQEILNIALLLGYDKDKHYLMSSLDFLELQGFKITRPTLTEWDLEFESPQHELLFAIKYSDVL